MYQIVVMKTTKQKAIQTPTSIRIPENIMKNLKKLADEEERSVSKQILYILKTWMKEKGHRSND